MDIKNLTDEELNRVGDDLISAYNMMLVYNEIKGRLNDEEKDAYIKQFNEKMKQAKDTVRQIEWCRVLLMEEHKKEQTSEKS